MRGPTARSETIAGLLVLLVVAVLGYATWTAQGGGVLGASRTASVVLPDDGPVLRAGAEVRVGGRRVGEVRSVTLPAGGRHAVARLSLRDQAIGRDATARVRLRGLAGSVFVELSPGDVARPLPDGGRLVPATTSVGLTDVVAAFDADARRALRTTVRAAGTGLSGRGITLQRTLATLPDTVEGLTGPLRALGRPGQLGGAVDAATGVSGAIAPDDLAATLPDARAVAATTAARAADLRATLRRVPVVEARAAQVLPGADALLDEADPALRQLAPAVADVVDALPELRRVQRRAPKLAAVERLARAATPVLRVATPVLERVRAPLGASVPFLDPVARFSRTLSPYRTELREAPLGFTRWGSFRYAFGQAPGARAVRFSMVFTCALARDPYPAPGQAATERSACGR